MNAEILSIGTELLLGQIVDTNAAHIAVSLSELGIGVFFKTVVGDNMERIQAAFKLALSRADLVITTGGLGPTLDDLTMEAVSNVMNEPLAKNDDVEDDIKSFFERIGRPMATNNLKQALVLKSAIIIRNRVGTAPGIIVSKGGKTVISMPGVPSEMRWMMENAVIPYLRTRVEEEGGATLVSKVLKVYGIGESKVDEMITDLLQAQSNPTIAPLASLLEVKLRITAKARSAEEALELISPVQVELERRLGSAIFGYDSDTMESVVGRLLTDRRWLLSTAESCTGGLIAKRMTDVAGSSAYIDRGFVTYSNTAKVQSLGVLQELLDAHGAVSSHVAVAMAEGCRQASKSDLAISVTGIAGPGGGTPEKPVGLVYIGLATPSGTYCEDHRFFGDRDMVRIRASQTALDMARRYMLGLAVGR